MELATGEILYENPLACVTDIEEFRVEGDACITFPRGRMRMEQAYDRDPERGLHANFLLWCPVEFPDSIAVSWEFQPRSDRGLAMFWVAAKGRTGEDLFDPSLPPRDGDYPQYHSGAINGLHVSYYRRNPGEIGFQTCNLRKSHGFHLVCQGADPLPSSRDASGPYSCEVIKAGPHFRFSINGLVLFHWVDDGERYGSILESGRIGFRQMAGLIGEYGNLKVQKVRFQP